jgi:hypothetical protein
VQVKKAKAFVLAQKQQLERDLGNLYTHLLGADVAGSGFDQTFVRNLVSASMLAIPAVLLLPVFCFCKGKRPTRANAAPVSAKGKKQKKK